MVYLRCIKRGSFPTSCRYETLFRIWKDNGVDIFFVISGFVMLVDNKRTVKDFLILRAIRIIPIYWLKR